MIRFTILVLILLNVTACKKDPNETYWSIKKNGKDWSVDNGTAGLNRREKKIVLTFSDKDKNGISKEVIGVFGLPLEVGTFDVDTFQFAFDKVGAYGFTLLGDGDVAGDWYYSPKPIPKNTITIERLDTVDNIVQGKFSFDLLIDKNRKKVSDKSPDVWSVTEGQFRVELTRF
jgi:hypothetical protein